MLSLDSGIIFRIPALLIAITVHEGRNRQIRRMCDFIGYPVRQLKRTHMANLNLEDLRRGDYRELTDGELKELLKAVGMNV